MPWSSAARGEENCTAWPSTVSVPSLCGCRPEMILIRVDFPAPLSPSTQVTSPARTVRLMPLQGPDGAVALAHVVEPDQGLALL